MCVGLLAGCLGPTRDPALVPAPAGPTAHGRWLRVQGPIADGFAAAVIRQMRAGYAEGLILESAGGSVLEGRKLGNYLRRHGKRTGTDGLCASACVDVLAGGVARYITPRARLGVHQSTLPPRLDSRDNHALLRLTQAAYLAEMGVEPAWPLRLARRPRTAMFWLSAADAVQLRLATAVVPRLPDGLEPPVVVTPAVAPTSR